MNARQLATRLADLFQRERAAMADFLLALADFDRERVWLELGYSSLFHFLHRELGMSKGAAFYRKTAAELVRRFPEVLEPLRDGRLCITTVIELAKVITHENREEVLPRGQGGVGGARSRGGAAPQGGGHPVSGRRNAVERGSTG